VRRHWLQQCLKTLEGGLGSSTASWVLERTCNVNSNTWDAFGWEGGYGMVPSLVPFWLKRERAPAETYPPAHTFSRSMGQRPIFCWRVMTPIHILQWMGEKGRIATRANWVGLDTSWVRRHWFQQSLKTLEGGLRPLTALWAFMTKTHHIHNVCLGLCPLGDE